MAYLDATKSRKCACYASFTEVGYHWLFFFLYLLQWLPISSGAEHYQRPSVLYRPLACTYHDHALHPKAALILSWLDVRAASQDVCHHKAVAGKKSLFIYAQFTALQNCSAQLAVI